MSKFIRWVLGNKQQMECPHCGELAEYDDKTGFYHCLNECPWYIPKPKKSVRR